MESRLLKWRIYKGGSVYHSQQEEVLNINTADPLRTDGGAFVTLAQWK